MNKKIDIFKQINQKLIILILLLVGLFFTSQIYFSSNVGTKSAEIEQIRREKDNVRLKNEILKAKIDEAISTKSLKSIAEQYNLTDKQVQEIEIAGQSRLAGIK